MSYFTTRKLFLFPSFDLDEKEADIFSKFYLFLEKTGVGDLIKKYINNNTKKGGRPNVNYFNLFAVILYGFSFGRDTLRELEEACKFDIRYINIMEQIRPSYTTFSYFINKVIIPNEIEIFRLINTQIIKEMDIKMDVTYIDGSKFEANANKYKFVWKPLTFHERISGTFFNLINKHNLLASYHKEKYVSSNTVSKAIDELSANESSYTKEDYESIFKALSNILYKVIEYEEKEAICGDNRNSYYKTDHDATAMCLKSDYYSGLGSNMHAAYNTQIAVSEGFVLSYYVSQSRVDINDFIPVLKRIYDLYNKYPNNVCADSGYGSYDNYKFLEDNNITSYVKYVSWEGNVSGRYPDSYVVNDDDTITCLNGKKGNTIEIENRHPKKANSLFYKIDGCIDCLFREYCMRFTKNHENHDYKIFEVNKELYKLKQKSEANLLSKEGIEIRVNRSIQVEGVFGIEKQDRGYVRIRRRGIKNASTEMMLVLLGLNIKKLFKYYETNKKNEFWKAPDNLEPQKFKKPSYKKLSKKGIKTNQKLYKNKQA